MFHTSLDSSFPPVASHPKVSPQCVRGRVMAPCRRLIKLSSAAWCASVTGRAARGLPHDGSQLHHTLSGLERLTQPKGPGHNTRVSGKKSFSLVFTFALFFLFKSSPCPVLVWSMCLSRDAEGVNPFVVASDGVESHHSGWRLAVFASLQETVLLV